MKNTALTVSGLIYLLVACVHFVRYMKAWEVVTLILAVWMFVAAKSKR
jgi:hypothetical protein